MSNYRPDIDGLRAVAIIPVVLYHAGLPLVSGGFVGVDVFFVISGFLITNIIAPECAAGTFSIVRFYERRARRLLPALFAVLFCSMLAASILLLPQAYEAFSWSALASLAFASNIWFWSSSTGYFASASDLMPLLHTWSLAVEEQFYIFYPILLVFLMRLGKAYAALGIILISLVSLCAAVWAVPKMPAASFYLLPTRIWELGIGAMLALGTFRGFMPSRGASSDVFSILAFAAILVPALIYDSETTFPGIAAIPPVFGAAALIHIGSSHSTLVHKLLASKPFIGVGLISYSLYLWHWPVLSFLRVYVGGKDLSLFFALTAVLASIIIASLSWRFIENPFRKSAEVFSWSSLIKSKFVGFSTRAVASIFLGCALTVAGSSTAVLVGNGFPNRFSDEVLAIERTSFPTKYRSGCMRKYSLDHMCRLGVSDISEDQVDLLLVGDSHAAAVAAAFDVVLKERHLSGVFMGNVACAPLFGVTTGRLEQQEGCRRQIDEAIEFAKMNPDVKYIVLAARWPVVVEAELMPGEPGRAYPLWIDSHQPVDITETKDNVFVVKKQLPKTLDQLAGKGRQLFLLGPIPEVGWNVPDKLIANLRWGRTMPANPHISSVGARQERSVEILQGVASSRSDTTYIEVANKICTPNCPTFNTGAAYYWDDDHLTPEGATQLISPLLRDVFYSDSP